MSSESLVYVASGGRTGRDNLGTASSHHGRIHPPRTSASSQVIRLKRVNGRPMTDTPSTPGRPPAPKRGAFPARKSEIDEAEPYVPGVGEPDENVDGEP